jgi:hypothetical protein
MDAMLPRAAVSTPPAVGSAPALRSSPSVVRPTGPVLFARYAFGPNRLGLCGPEDWRSLLELGAEGAASDEGGDRSAAREVDRGLRDLAGRFEGAYPYLQLIATAHGLSDPLDRRVVDAYWIGNSLSDRVDAGLLQRSLATRFRPQLRAAEWRWLAEKPAGGAHPTHAFHVLDVYPRVSLTRRGPIADEVGLMDACRIRWGRVLEVLDERLVVDVVPLRMVDGRLALGPPRPQPVRRWFDGRGFVTDVSVGDTVSLHWDWACEVLEARRLAALRSRTLHQLALANATL